MRLSKLILLALVLIFVVQIGYYYLNLPDVVASHFDAAGNPNGWMTKGAFAIFELILLGVIVGHFALVPFLVDKMPDSLINLPNKQFWLAPERRAETIAIIGSYFEWFSVMILVVFVVVNHAVYRANLKHENLSDGLMFMIIGGFLFCTVVWMLSLVQKFRKTG